MPENQLPDDPDLAQLRRQAKELRRLVIDGDSVTATATELLDAGADPNAGYLWHGLPAAFTVLTGLLGEGEQGPRDACVAPIPSRPLPACLLSNIAIISAPLWLPSSLVRLPPGEQVLLDLEVPVDDSLADAGLLGDLLDRRTPDVAAGGEGRLAAARITCLRSAARMRDRPVGEVGVFVRRRGSSGRRVVSGRRLVGSSE